MIELGVLYHGTKFKYIADSILRNGFEPWTYFSKDLNDAIYFGGKYVFLVVFNKADLPDNWQVRCESRVSPTRITKLLKCSMPKTVFHNKELEKEVFSNALEYPQRDYCFKEELDLNKLL